VVLTLVGMSQEEYFRGPFWATLPRAAGVRPLILGIADRSEPQDYQKFSAKHGAFYQFLLLNEDAVMACNAAQIKLIPLDSIDYGALIDKPTLLCGMRPAQPPRQEP
jgi:hypothetical protein